jgi:hypothetical protein
MSEVLDRPITFRRVELRDIEEMAPWLFPRVRAAFPAASDAMVRSFLTQAHMAADQWCGRTDQACAVAYIESGVLGAPPLIRTVFSFAEHGMDDSLEIGELYFQIAQWARRMNALGVEIAPYTDGDRLDIRQRIGKLVKGDRWFWMTARPD